MANDNSIISTTKTQEEQQALTPWQALERLRLGNVRFVTNTRHQRDFFAQVVASSTKQFPSAIILSCMDSRGPAEIIFDQGIGDIFSQRLAGNVVNEDVLGGMEFAAQVVGAKLIVVLGHTSCGAVMGACSDVKLGNLTGLLEKIKPSVDKVREEEQTVDCDYADHVDKIAKQNVLDGIEQIKNGSPILRKLIEEGTLGIVGAMHDLSTGKVNFFEDIHSLPGTPTR